ncbi:Secretion protein HlyD [Pseudomonas syringae pv. pisi]|uniref:Secretion protein HlyD n=3 Tax=Pseudomonas syringae group TaxID=136849 RepID=A0A3M3BTG9_PSESJ|nr:Secretion protein HlyD [Pseudomonas syringae pv. pisi]RMU75681.1 Secretion protein HlyD [Pseudomonas syringae pv. aptata]RMU90367.1 hypothetical protein ALP21_200015 [Pseudomonas savastanoi pv. phaseolicola]RML63479.1 hypothetical protein ALQ92_200267 [Pseudomonas syringae pv. pisi]RMM15902.1 Secretion protein HlyD [Pseudomonas syringae pv. pisi]
MKRSRHPRRALLVALCLFPIIAVCAWQILPDSKGSAATVTVTRGTIENSVTALGTCSRAATWTWVRRPVGRS